MKIKKIELISCSLNLGELHKISDFEHFHPNLECIDEYGNKLNAAMRLHISEPLERLLFADPRQFEDGGIGANSVGSRIIKRKQSYLDIIDKDISKNILSDEDISFFEVDVKSLNKMLLRDYDFAKEVEVFNNSKKSLNRIAFTCHDPNIIGGGNIILFRLINWLAELGIKVSVYSCGTPPSWKKVEAEFHCFKTYDKMFSAIDEEIVILYSMWHIEGMLKTNPIGKKVYHIRQIYEPFHYGIDYDSMIGNKSAIQLLESLPIGVITISPHLENYYKRFNNLESYLITNGLDPGVFYPTKKREIDKNHVQLVSVSDPDHFIKGSKVLAEALKNLANKRKDIRFEWRIISGAKRKLKFGTLPNNLRILSLSGLNQIKMREEYNNADIVVNPSLYEGFGLPTLEAMLCGAPVVQSDNLGLDFILENEKDCLIVPVNDSSAMAISIEKIIDDKELAKNLSTNGFKKAMLYTTYHQFNMFYKVFEKILNTQFNSKTIQNIESELKRFVIDPESIQKDVPLNKSYNPLISIVIPAYNQAEYLKEALDSLIAQTYTNWEAVVVNDGSTDNTQEVMESYAEKDSRIRPYSKTNGGITSALNAGLEKAKGEFFCWLSSDDLFYPEKLELQVNAFKDLDESYALVYGSFDILKHEINTIDVQPFQNPIIPGCEFPEAMKFDFIDGCTIMIRINVMREVNGFNPSIIHSQDMELWVRLASYGYKFHLLPHKLTIRRVHEAQSSTSNMIHCRYDAAWMINFYMDNYHLTEMYRYIDFKAEDGIKQFAEHFVGRMLHTEANINHPLLQEKFWNWFIDGIKAFSHSLQNVLLRNVLIQLINHRNTTYKMDFYIDKCLFELNNKRTYEERIYNYSVVDREFSKKSRASDVFGKELLDYGLSLLVNAYTPLFAQELYFHDTNKVVDTPYKLAHSVFRYLSQFENPTREIVKPYVDLSYIPENKLEALNLFCDLAFPKITESLKTSLAYSVNGEMDFEKIQAVENVIKLMPSEYKKELKEICNANPTSVILYYWYALTLEIENKIDDALETSWKIFDAEYRFFSWSMVYQVALWAEKVKDYERAFYAYTIAGELNPSFEKIKNGLKKAYGKYKIQNHTLPIPVQFIKNEVKIDLPKTTLVDCEIQPLLNGTFIFKAICLDIEGNEFKAGGNIEYAEKLEFIIVTNLETQKKYHLVAKDIFNFFTNSYSFNNATEYYIKNRLRENEKLSIAFSVPNASVISGGAIIVYRFANWLAKLGVKVAIYSNSTAPDWINLDAEFHTFSTDSTRYESIKEDNIIAFSVLELQKILRFHSGDKRIFHISQVVEDFHYHGFDFDSIMKPKGIFEILHSLPVGRISVSKHINSYLREKYKQKSYLIENGIDLTIFKPKWRKYISNGELTITTLGNPDRMLKGVNDVVEAVKLLIERRTDLRIKLIIVSDDKPKLDNFIYSTHHNFNVTLLWGLLPEEVKDIYHQTDIYVNGSWYEGFGLPSLEAMACGVPVIQANNKGLDGIIKNKINCILYPPSDVEELSNALEKLLVENDLREKLIEEGLITANKYSISNQFDAFINAFEKMLICKFNDNVVKSIKYEIQNGTVDDQIIESRNLLHPRFSIIIPVTEHSNKIKKTLNSLISQLYVKWEAVIVYTGKEREVSSIIRSYATNDLRIKYIESASKKYSTLLNCGLKHCNGDWIINMPSGVFYSNDRLINLVNAIEQVPDKKILYSEYYLSRNDDSEPQLANTEWLHNIPSKFYQILGLLNYNYIFSSSMIIHHSVFDELGYYNEMYDSATEFYQLLKIHTKFQSEFIRAGGCAGYLPLSIEQNGISQKVKEDYGAAITDFIEEYKFDEIFPLIDFKYINEVEEVFQSVNLVLSNKKSTVNITGTTKQLEVCANKWLEKWKYKNTVQTKTEKRRSENSKVKKKVHSENLNKIKDQSKSKKEKIVSIVLLSYNNKNYTEECLNSIKKFTKQPYEIVIVDNASNSQTIVYLKSFESQNNNCTLILNTRNLGFPAGNNIGILKSKGNFIVLINNDTIVTKGWLERMVEIAESDNKIGIVGPISNSVSGVQIDKEAKYKSIPEMHTYAQKIRKKNRSKIMDFPRVAFLCTLIKRDVIDSIGGLDERFSPGNYEDDDFCLRAQLAGYKTVIAKDVFIHHFGSKSFTEDGNDKYLELLEINKTKFIDKWGADPNDIWLKGVKPKSGDIVYPLNENTFIKSFRRATKNISEKDFKSASNNLKVAIEKYKINDGSNIIDYDTLLNLAGNVSLINGDYPLAREYFEEELNLKADSSIACSGLAEVLFVEENYEESKTMYEWAVKNDMQNEAALKGLRKVNTILQLPEDENSLFGKSQNSLLDNADAIIKNAHNQFESKNFNEALTLVKQAEELMQDDSLKEQKEALFVSLNNFKGYCYIGLNKLDEAKSLFKGALQIEPNSSDSCAGLGEVIYLSGNDEEAKTMFEWAVKNDPENIFALEGLKKVNKNLGFEETHNSLLIIN